MSSSAAKNTVSMKRKLFSWTLMVLAFLMLLTAIGLCTGKMQILFNGGPKVAVSCVTESSQDCASDNSKRIDSKDTLKDGETNFTDLNGFTLVPEDGDDLPTADEVRQMDIRAAGRFVIPSIKMDVPLNKMHAKNGVATPPGYRAAYILEGYTTGDTNPTGGKTIVAMHSAMHGFPPGNYLINENNGKATLPNGTIVGVGGVQYRITGHEEISKPALPDAQQVWKDEPGKLVIITCRQIGGPKTTENTVFYGDIVK